MSVSVRSHNNVPAITRETRTSVTEEQKSGKVGNYMIIWARVPFKCQSNFRNVPSQQKWLKFHIFGIKSLRPGVLTFKLNPYNKQTNKNKNLIIVPSYVFIFSLISLNKLIIIKFWKFPVFKSISDTFIYIF